MNIYDVTNLVYLTTISIYIQFVFLKKYFELKKIYLSSRNKLEGEWTTTSSNTLIRISPLTSQVLLDVVQLHNTLLFPFLRDHGNCLTYN